MHNTMLNILKRVAKTCEKVLRLNMTNNTNLVTKEKVENFHSQLKAVIDFNLGRHKDLSTLKVIFTLASVNITFG